MIKSLLKQNKLVQRLKAIKDLVLEKLDAQNLKADVVLEKLDAQNLKIDKQAEISSLILENQALFLKFSIDMLKGLQMLIEDSKILHNKLIEIDSKLTETDLENQAKNLETKKLLEDVYSDIHNQKCKVVTDPIYFQGIEIELMVYLYSFLPYHRAIDIGANRGDISLRLLQAGYEVYAFEPFTPVLTKLKERFINHSHFHAFPFALGSSNETKDLHIAMDITDDKIYDDQTFYNSLTRHSLSEGLIFTETVLVNVRTLVSLHESGEVPCDIGLVKSDTEGFELEVIKGMGNFRYSVVIVEFWDKNFPFGQVGAMNSIKEMVSMMKDRNYLWHIIIYRIWGSHDISYYCNSDYSIDNSWGNVFFFQDYAIFSEALKWCSSVMPATYFSA